uniref:Uncharacterized LOC114655228 n=1 Tax=Erpetoichthys calabaricus TaxID=27687 RepID=A0A8C4TKY0_ERPCA
MQTLRKHKVDLIEWLSGDPQLVLQHVQCQALVTDREYRRLRSIQDPERRVIDLLDTLLSKGDAHCQQFIALLRGLQDTYPQLQAWFGQLGITGAPAALGCSPWAAPPDHEAKARQADAMVSGPPQMSQDAQQGSRFTVQAFRGSNAVAPMLTAVGGTIDMPIMIGDWPGPRPQVVSSEEGALDELEFLRLRLPQLAQRVKNVEAIIDELGAASFSSEAISDIRAQRTAENKVREMVRYANNCQAARDLYRALLSHESHLMAELA